MTVNTQNNLLEKKLESRFISLWNRCLLQGCQDKSDQSWQKLAKHYSESHRLYHTLNHLDFCLNEFDTAKFMISEPDTLEMAIWYHDIINTPRAADNEYQSQLLFQSEAKDSFGPQCIEKVCKLIMVTTHRQQPNTPDEEYICDIDLSSMGESWDKFITDSNALRAECILSTEEYSLGKLKFFNSLLERPRIFYSDFFHDRYETNARHNIQRYITIINQMG